MAGIAILFLCLLHLMYQYHALGTEELYTMQRDILEQREREYAGYDVSLDQDERIVNSYLEYLKLLEFNRTRADFPPARPLVYHVDEIRKTKVYEVLKKLPKGGNMHLHHNHVVSKSKIWDIIVETKLYDHLYVNPKTWQLNLYMNPPPGWIRVSDNSTYYTKSRIVGNAVFIKQMNDTLLNNPTNAGLRWHVMGPLFGRMGSSLINQANVTKRHMQAMLQAAMDENVQYLETKSSAYNKLYVLDSDPMYATKNGKHFIDNDDGEEELLMMSQVVKDFIKKNPNFIGYKRIINSSRRNKKFILSDIKRAFRLYKKYPHIVSGYDMVGEEDKGYSLLFFLKDFVDTRDSGESVPLFFHTAETNWPDDLLASNYGDDAVNAMQNVYEAIILGAKRVGHGIGFIHHPYLINELKVRNIAVEANPISNKMLGYVPDQRHHPAITYLRSGVPVVLGADDPATFGYDSFTVDWYEAFMGWGLDLADMRQLANNSLTYSSLNDAEKAIALQKWSTSWRRYITQMKNEACSLHFVTTPYVSGISPSEGHSVGGTTVRVFGRHFERSICNRIICRFGTMQSEGVYVYNYLIKCPTPPVAGTTQISAGKVDFSVSLDGGHSFITTNQTFTFIGVSAFGGSPMTV